MYIHVWFGLLRNATIKHMTIGRAHSISEACVWKYGVPVYSTSSEQDGSTTEQCAQYITRLTCT